MLWPCFLARRRSRRTFFISFLFLYFPLYNDDVLFCETVLEKRIWVSLKCDAVVVEMRYNVMACKLLHVYSLGNKVVQG